MHKVFDADDVPRGTWCVNARHQIIGFANLEPEIGDEFRTRYSDGTLERWVVMSITIDGMLFTATVEPATD